MYTDKSINNIWEAKVNLTMPPSVSNNWAGLSQIWIKYFTIDVNEYIPKFMLHLY